MLRTQPAMESLAIASLFHDLCKVNYYKPDKRNKKVNGTWVEVPFFSVEEKFHFGGHGSKSVFILQQFIKLTAEEAVAINCHMGFSDGASTSDVSNAYETEPAYGIATPVANAVAEIRTELHPLVLLDYLLRVEDQLGRTRETSSLGHGPRTIDCDLCWIEGERHQGARLTLPHPGLGEREFVLVPMEDLMPDPMRFFGHAGVVIQPVDQRVGRIMSDLGPVDWQRTN